MQLEGRWKAEPANGHRRPAHWDTPVQALRQFLIANLELEFDLTIPESSTYDFLIANKMRFYGSKTFALLRGFSSFQHRASSL